MIAVTRIITADKDAVNVIYAPDGQHAAVVIPKQETDLNLAFFRTADLTDKPKPFRILTSDVFSTFPKDGVMIASTTNILRIAPVGLSAPGDPPGALGSGQVIVEEHFLTNETFAELSASEKQHDKQQNDQQNHKEEL